MRARTDSELELMRQSGRVSAMALKSGLAKIEAGVNLLEIEKVVREVIQNNGAEPAFMTVAGYKWASCLCIDDEVVHGIPKDRVLKKGELVTIDTGAKYQGWCTDTAWTVEVGGGSNKFLAVGEEAMWAGVKQAKAGNRVGDISAAMQEVVEGRNGLVVIRSLVGHGVGRALHEEPEVPGFGKRGSGPMLQEGMTLAIEIMYSQSSDDVKLGDDGWVYQTLDGSLSGMFEMSVIVGKNGPEVLTDWRKI